MSLTRSFFYSFLLVLMADAILSAGPVTESKNKTPHSQSQLVVQFSSDSSEKILKLKGRDSRRQLVVSEVRSGTDPVDVTRSSHYQSIPSGLLKIDAEG